MGPLLICYDGSVCARRAIAVAAGLFAGRAAVVLDVAPLQLVAGAYAAAGSGAAATERLVYEDALARAEEGAQLARRAGLPAAARAVVDAPTWMGVLQIAEELDAAAIVIGSRGLAGIREHLERSLSHDVTRHANRPVLLVPRRA